MNIFTYFKNKGIDTLDPTFYDNIRLWRSWYQSDVKKFHRYKVYRGNGGSVKCRRISLGMAKRVCEDQADLLLNERVQITLTDKVTDDFVKGVLAENTFDELGNEYQERKSALGTVAYVVQVTDGIADEEGNLTGGDIVINYVEADHIYPTSWQNNRVIECIFTFPKTYKRKKYVLFQYHKLEEIPGGDGARQYVIENSVVEDTTGSGRELTREEWNEIPQFVGLPERWETGSDKPCFIIDRLNIVNNIDDDNSNPLGISIFANAVDILQKIDLEYDSYANEFSLGRKRIFVAPEFLTSVDGNVVFDPDDTVFYELPENFFKDSKEALREVNMELRIDEHSKAINDDLNFLSVKCGFGTERYKFDHGDIQTATEVISDNSDMYRTLQKHELVLERVLKDLIRAIIRAGVSTGIGGLNPDTEITIMFDDSIIEDKASERAEDRRDVSMGAMSVAEYRAKWYGETLEEAQSKLPEQFGGGDYV